MAVDCVAAAPPPPRAFRVVLSPRVRGCRAARYNLKSLSLHGAIDDFNNNNNNRVAQLRLNRRVSHGAVL